MGDTDSGTDKGTCNRSTAVTTPASPPALRLDGARKTFRRETGESVLALDNITFSMSKGELASLVGPD